MPFSVSPEAEGKKQTYFEDISAASENDVWAAGWYRINNRGSWSFLAHWNGVAWSETHLPFSQEHQRFYSIEVLASDNVWVVGEEFSATDQPVTVPLIVHWDGKTWERVQAPALEQGAYNPRLVSTVAISPTDIWAVGNYMVPSPGRPYDAEWLLIMHWDGISWKRVSTEDIPGLEYDPKNRTNSGLHSISASSWDNVWALGSGGSGKLLMHWDGREWSVPQRTGIERMLHLETIVTAGKEDVWLFGEGNGNIRAVHGGAVGKEWIATSIPVRGASRGPVSVKAALAKASNDVWAFGSDYVFRNSESRGDRQLVTAHWDGTQWTAQASFVEGTDRWAEVYAATFAGDDIWTAGYPFLRYTTGPCPPQSPPTLTTPAPSPTADPGPPEQLPGTSRRTFPETGFTVEGTFLDYWDNHGGLAQQGYPISEPLREVSPLDGRPYTMQYFERAVFEYHPENQAPNQVLLSQLGTFEYKKRYPKGAPNQQRNMSPASLYFPETGKWLGGEFLQYWQAHGGLAQQGYPISDEFTEKSALNGEIYKVQYFERTVFELHPRNPVPHNVLLAQLGRFRYDETYGPEQGRLEPPPTDQLIAKNVLGSVVANERYLFWIANEEPGFSLYGYDLQENTSFLISDAGGYKYSLACDDNFLAWVEMGKDQYPPTPSRPVHVRIKKLDLESMEITTVREGKTSDQVRDGYAAIRDSMLYYNYGLGAIWMQSLTSSLEYPVISDGRDPVISGEVMLWSKSLSNCLPGGGRSMCIGAQELYIRTTRGGEDTLLASYTGQFPFQHYAVHGNRVVWTNNPDFGTGAPPLLHSISEGKTITMSQQHVNFPMVRDDLIVWGSVPGVGKDWSIDRYYPASGAITVLLQSATPMYPQALMGHEALAYIASNESPKHGYRTSGDLYLLRLQP
jgi:hypothetical protein